MKLRLSAVVVVVVCFMVVFLITAVANGSPLPAGAIKSQAVQSPAIALGQPGLSFRYVQTIGETDVPYFVDGDHLFKPHSVWIDAAGSLYVTEVDGQRLLKYSAAGAFQFGAGKASFSGYADDEFNYPLKVTVDVSGTIYVADTASHRIKVLDHTGAYVGQLGETAVNGTDDAHFDLPAGVALDAAGNIYVADTGNHRIQVFDNARNFVAMLGEVGVAGTDNAHFDRPEGVAFDSAGNIYIADSANNRIQKFNSSRVYVATLGETGVAGSDNAHFDFPNTVAVDGANNLYVVDILNHRIQRFRNNLVYSDTLGVTGATGNDNAHFQYPTGVAVNKATSEVYVADIDNHRVQVFNQAFVYQRTIGVTDVPYLTDSYHYNWPVGTAVDSLGGLYILEEVGNRLTKLSSSGTFAWSIGQVGLWGDANNYFNTPSDLAVDAANRVYVVDSGNHRVQIFNINGGWQATLGSNGTGNNQFNSPQGIAIAPNGDIYVADTYNQRVQIYNSNRVYVATLGGTGDCSNANNRFCEPADVAVDSTGTIYVADRANQRVQVFNSGRNYVRTIGGAASCTWPPLFDEFCYPDGLAIDANNNLYVADNGNNRIEVFDPTGAYLTTIGGNWTDTTGGLREPRGGIAFDKSGDLYVADSRNFRVQKYAPGVPGWRQKNINGFGVRNNQGATALEVFNGKLYAGASNWDNGGSIWRTGDGSTWEQVSELGFGSAYTNTNPAIIDMVVFNNQLYASTGWDGVGGQIWRSSNGTAWTQVEGNGFGDADNAIQTMVVFSNTLYAGTGNSNRGFQIWRSSSGDSLSWTNVVTDGLGHSNNRSVTGLTVYNGFLYAAVDGQISPAAGMQVWRTSNGADWVQVNVDGFGDVDNTQTGGLATFGGNLYVGTGNQATGAQLWLSDNGTTWSQVMGNGFGDSNNVKVETPFVVNGNLYAVLNNGVTGLEVWRSSDGATWSRVNTDGFGDSNNVTAWWHAVAVFNNSLFVGTWNGDGNGGEIWQLLKQVYLPLVLRY
jgi:hypothetical protein